MRALLYFALIFIFCSCSHTTHTPQQKAENSIMKYLNESLDDPSSYEPISFSVLEAEYIDFKYSSPENKLIHDTMISLVVEMRKWNMEKLTSTSKLYTIDIIEDSLQFYHKKVKDYRKQVYNEAEAKYKNSDRKQIGWTIIHSFEVNDEFGVKIQRIYCFTLNNDFSIKDSQSLCHNLGCLNQVLLQHRLC